MAALPEDPSLISSTHMVGNSQKLPLQEIGYPLRSSMVTVHSAQAYKQPKQLKKKKLKDCLLKNLRQHTIRKRSSKDQTLVYTYNSLKLEQLINKKHYLKGKKRFNVSPLLVEFG